MLLPEVRVMRLRLLFESLVKETPPTHVEHAARVACVTRLHKIASNVNAASRIAEQVSIVCICVYMCMCLHVYLCSF